MFTCHACRGPAVPPGNVGIAVWDGTGCVDVGVFDTEKDARQAANVMLKVGVWPEMCLSSVPYVLPEMRTATTITTP
jgi:hypothetical protein